MTDITIRPLAIDDAPVCDAIIASLPYFFGDPDGVRDCAAAVRLQAGYVATIDGDVAAFLTIERHDPKSADHMDGCPTRSSTATASDANSPSALRTLSRAMAHACSASSRSARPYQKTPATTTPARARSTGVAASCRCANWDCVRGTTRTR